MPDKFTTFFFSFISFNKILISARILGRQSHSLLVRVCIGIEVPERVSQFVTLKLKTLHVPLELVSLFLEIYLYLSIMIYVQ